VSGTKLRADEWLYLLVIALLPVAWPLQSRVGVLSVPPADFVFVLAAAAWAWALITGRAKLRRSWFYLPLALYLAACACSAVASADPALSAVKLAGKVYLVGLAVLTFNLVASLASLRRALRAWLVGAAVAVAACLVGVVLFYAGVRGEANAFVRDYGSLPPGNYPRVQGLLGFASLLCNYLSVSLMIAAAAHACGWLSARWFRPLAFAIVASAVLTFSPHVGGIALSVGLWLWLRLRRTRYRLAGRALLVGGSAVAVAVLLSAVLLLFDRGPQGVYSPLARGQALPAGRVLIWRAALDTVARHPVFGRGVGTEVVRVEQGMPSGKRHVLTDAHNTVLSVAGETGLVGLVALGCLVIFLARGLWPLSLNRGAEAAVKTCFAIALLDALLYQSLTGSFEDSRHLWALFGLVAAAKAGWAETGLNEPGGSRQA
jgi:putative inorganic carbon (hco3(-)) transporter